MKKFLPQFAIFSALFVANSYAGQYPGVSGSALFQSNADRVISTQKTHVPGNNAFVYVESDFALHMTEIGQLKLSGDYSQTTF